MQISPSNPSNAGKTLGQKRRTARVNFYRIQNLRLAAEIDRYQKSEQNLTDVEKAGAIKLEGKLRVCSHHSLYRTFGGSRPDAVYITGMACKHRLCFICNSARKNKLRQMFLGYFSTHPQLLETYDFMHLTLTVPHTVEGWAGKQVYHTELLKAFHELRRLTFWKKQVYGGWYTVEFTEGTNGLHIHIHALALVHAQPQSRNRLYLDVLQNWNFLTHWQGANRQAFTPDQAEGIKKSLAFLDRPTPPWVGAPSVASVFARLKPSGSTLVGLNNLYKKNPDGSKDYNARTPEALLPMILETLKYHFDPVTLYRAPDDPAADYPQGFRFDVKKIVRMLPLLSAKRLYGTFGAFYQNPDLRLTLEAETDENGLKIEKALDLGEVLDPATGQPAPEGSYGYGIYDPSQVRVIRQDNQYGRAIISGQPRYIFPTTLPKALSAFADLVRGEILKAGAGVKKNLVAQGLPVNNPEGNALALINSLTAKNNEAL